MALGHGPSGASSVGFVSGGIRNMRSRKAPALATGAHRQPVPRYATDQQAAQPGLCCEQRSSASRSRQHQDLIVILNGAATWAPEQDRSGAPYLLNTVVFLVIGGNDSGLQFAPGQPTAFGLLRKQNRLCRHSLERRTKGISCNADNELPRKEFHSRRT